MKKILLLLTLSTLLFSEESYIWTQDTKAMSQEKSEKIIKAFKNNTLSELTFEDDPIRDKKSLAFKENIFALGLSAGSSSYDEEISNTTGSQTSNYSVTNFKFTLAKDYTLWHKEYTQPTRIYFTYALNSLENDVDFSTWTLGLRENMYYWPLYSTPTYTLYPTASLEIGSSRLKRNSNTMSGFTTELEVGLSYSRYDNFEYALNLNMTSVAWKHPLDGVADEMQGIGVNFGVTYKFMYGDFQ